MLALLARGPWSHWSSSTDGALELRRTVATTVRELFSNNPKMYSYMVYKLGGYCARGGKSEEAIGAIRKALAVNPSLSEQLRKDTDPDPLRGLLEFQALYEH